MSTNTETSEAASPEVTTLPIVTKPGRVPIKSWAGELDPRTLEQATNVSNLPFAIDRHADVAFGSFVVSGNGRGRRLETDRRHRQG